MNAQSTVRNPFAVGLSVVGIVCGGVGALLAIVALNESSNYASEMSLAGIAAMNAWSSFLLLVAVVSFVGAAVLAGVRWLVRSVSVASLSSDTAPDHTAADGL